MRKALFTLAALSSALSLPLTAHADTIDDFTLTGGGHTITFSLPATSAFPDFSLFNFFQESASTTIDGVSGYTTQGSYYVIPTGPTGPLMILAGLPSSVFGTTELFFHGPTFWSVTTEPATNPPPYLQEDIVPTFTPGCCYTLSSFTPPAGEFPPGPTYNLMITQEDPTAATPEPSTFALLGTGLIGAIASVRRRIIRH